MTFRLVDEGHGRFTVWVGDVPSSPIDVRHPERLAFEYLAWMDAVLETHRDGPVRALHLGGAGCALAWAWAVTRPGSRQVAVEIDPELAVAVREWFDLPRSPQLRIRVGDAAAVLATRHDASADVIVRDAFDAGRTPVHLTSTTFVAEVARVLTTDGLYLANSAEGPDLLRREIATAATVFPHVAVVAEPGALKRRRFANAVLVASRRPLDATAIHRACSRVGVSLTVLHGTGLDRFTAGARALECEAQS